MYIYITKKRHLMKQLFDSENLCNKNDKCLLVFISF